ncbi:MAG: hypothetical protein AAB373_05875 [Patescibacteria group bacterium]
MDKTWIVILVLVFFAVDLVIAFLILYRRFKRSGLKPEELQYIKSHWIRIIDSFKSHPKEAILDADKLLDYALGKKGLQGNLGEKLKQAKGRFTDINQVWNAHKLRNKIAHELMEIDIGEAKMALAQFKRGLNDLGAML